MSESERKGSWGSGRGMLGALSLSVCQFQEEALPGERQERRYE